MSSFEPDPSYPVLREWLRGSKPSNPWVPFLDGTLKDPGFCAALEEILERLERKSPPGLGSLRKRFGDDDEGNVYGLRTELLIGSHLAKAQVSFRFGSTGEPDFCCETDPNIWIEARMRGRDDLRLLQSELRVALQASSVDVTLTVERRLAISAENRQSTISTILAAVDGNGPSDELIRVPLSELAGTATIKSSPLGVSSVAVGPATTELAQHMNEVEREIGNVVVEKSRQSLRNDWSQDALLVIDASRLGMAWLRPEEAWKGRLASIAPSWGEIPFLGVIVMFGGLTSNRIQAEGVFRPDLGPPLRESVNRILGAIGLTPI